MASKRRIRRKACGRKIRYETVAEATKAKYQIIRFHNDKMESYRCAFCNGWHLGHSRRTR